MTYVVELENGVWLHKSEGAPGRTLCPSAARPFHTLARAERALKAARKFKPFENARIYQGNY